MRTPQDKSRLRRFRREPLDEENKALNEALNHYSAHMIDMKGWCDNNGLNFRQMLMSASMAFRLAFDKTRKARALAHRKNPFHTA